MNLKFFEVPECMRGEKCKLCGIAVTDGVLVQENVPGGGGAIFHKHCLDALLNEEGPETADNKQSVAQS